MFAFGDLIPSLLNKFNTSLCIIVVSKLTAKKTIKHFAKKMFGGKRIQFWTK